VLLVLHEIQADTRAGNVELRNHDDRGPANPEDPDIDGAASRWDPKM
jgi:hypothetical protein